LEDEEAFEESLVYDTDFCAEETEIPKLVPVDCEPPAFSWVGKMDPKGFQFVASKRGVHYYPLDDPAAVLIRREDFVGYRTAAAAQADGKIPIQ